MTDKLYDVIIIGAGPAGLSAGIYCAREKFETLIISKSLGGQMAVSAEIENYLGFHLIPSPELVRKFEEHIKDFGLEPKTGVEVKSIEGACGDFKIKTLSDEFRAKTVLIASGRLPRRLNVLGETELSNRGVSYCAICDGPLFKDKTVAVIGGGNSALETVFHLDKIVKKIYLLNVNPKFGNEADPVMLDKIKKSNKTEVIFSAKTQNILGEDFVRGLKYLDQQTNEEKEIALDGVFVRVGNVPASGFIKDLLKLNELDEIKIDKHNMTCVEGIFAAGDVTECPWNQVIIAAGEGAKAALGISEFLAKRK